MSSGESWVKTRLPLKWVEGFQFQGNAPIQEDYFEVNPERGIFILADGFGGSAGKLAAEIVVKSVKQFLEQEAGDLDATLPFELRPYYSLAGNVLFNAVSFANQKLIKAFADKSWLESGGASMIAGYMEGKLLAIANVGACSVFLSRGGKTKELVVPKTLARQVNPFEEGAHHSQGVPLMSFGSAKQLEPEVTEVELRAGDQLCFQTPHVSPFLRQSLFQLESASSLSAVVEAYPSEHPMQSNSSVIWVSF